MSQRIKQRTTSNGAQRQAKRKSIPSVDQMPKVLQVWFTLPLVTKPTAITYPRIVALLKKLAVGAFPTEYDSLREDGFTHRDGVPPILRKHLSTKWTDEVLAQLLDGRLRLIIEDVSYWPENKEKLFKGMSFESFVFNKHAGRSWLLELHVRPPRMLQRESERRLLKEDPYPEAMYKLSDVMQEIDVKHHPDQYATATRLFSKIMGFLQVLPCDPEAEWGLQGLVNKGSDRVAGDIAQTIREHFSWIKDPHPGLLKINGKLILKWLEQYSDEQFFFWPGGDCCDKSLLRMHDEFVRYGKILSSQEAREDRIEVEPRDPAEEAHRRAEERWYNEETSRRRKQEILDNLAPEDKLPMSDGEQECREDVVDDSVSGMDKEDCQCDKPVGFEDDDGEQMVISAKNYNRRESRNSLGATW